MPEELRHRRLELIFYPLDEPLNGAEEWAEDYERTEVDKIMIPSRKERDARR